MTVPGGFHHVKLPVSSVHKSLEWYRRLLGPEVAIEFVEDGVLRGVANVADRTKGEPSGEPSAARLQGSGSAAGAGHRRIPTSQKEDLP
ncbi:VOC family protein [Streptosporangium sp. NPDC002544]|uniref:VOC family protein n=1 Tax=Streptosporangium sp. NPDC002544 TaxID=3154538 RepID=UPI0033221747